MSSDDTQPDPALERTMLGAEPVADPVAWSDTVLRDGSEPGPLEVGTRPLVEDRFSQRYESRALLGKGGMGEVHLARDERVGREVAVKTIRAEIEKHAGDRFLREARVQGQLEHPAVVPVYDIGLTDEGRLFFTMKRIRGRSLDSILSGIAAGDPATIEGYPRRRLLVAFYQLCLALEYAHARGVLHRDLKPGNLMLGDFGEVHVLDWGLARVAESGEPAEEATSLGGVDLGESGPGDTVAGSIIGTPGYMAPEQARGELDRLDRRTDVYSLGAILFEILFGDALHPQDNAVARLTATLVGPSVPIAERADAADVPPELAAIVERATAIEPGDRFRSARELATAVERYLDGERDEARRRELAAAHVEKATELARHSERRVEALRELGRALALDPSHAEALATLERLLSSLPDEVPDGARAELAAMEGDRRLGVLRASAVRAVSWLLALPLVIAFGVIDWTRAGIAIVLVLANIAVSAGVVRAGRHDERAIYAVLAVSSLCVAGFSFLLGPLVLVPGFAATNAMMFALAAGPAVRRGAILLSIASFAVPMLLSVIGLDATYYTSAAPNALTITSPMSQLPLAPTVAFLLAALAALIVTPTVLAGRMQDRLAAAERRVFLQAFHLRQLVPRPDDPAR